MLALVDDLLDVTTISRGKLTLERQWVDISRLLDRLCSQNRVLAQLKNIDVLLQSEMDPEARVYLDQTRFSQVVNNLISNAVKFSPEGSQIMLDCSVDQEHFRVQVKDQGPGIPEDEIKGVFDMYQRTSVTSTGGEKSTGLGLAIASKIVHAHGGELDVKSEIGVGTIFSVSIPHNSRKDPSP
jgi:signal transduction histidine kinase